MLEIMCFRVTKFDTDHQASLYRWSQLLPNVVIGGKEGKARRVMLTWKSENEPLLK